MDLIQKVKKGELRFEWYTEDLWEAYISWFSPRWAMPRDEFDAAEWMDKLEWPGFSVPSCIPNITTGLFLPIELSPGSTGAKFCRGICGRGPSKRHEKGRQLFDDT